ncbi:MAG: hypothetical protein ACR2IP_04670 [Solirubrobacteraceae bacterium]
MVDPLKLELDELLTRPGTYFNPQTEVLVIVDDSPEIQLEDHEGSDWLLISDETPVEENRRDELLEAFQVRHLRARGDAIADAADEGEDEEEGTEELGAGQHEVEPE